MRRFLGALSLLTAILYTIWMVMSFSFSSRAYNRLNVAREFRTLPLTVFSPTRMQPAESSSVLPEWIRMPRKCGTSCRQGIFRLYLGLYSSAGRDGCLGVDLFPAGAGTAARGVRTCCRKVPYGILDRVTEKFAADGQVSYGIGRAFELASEC